jgi:uncharacterized protein (TIGR02594 family)
MYGAPVKYLAAIVIAFCAFTATAEARPHHRGHHARHQHRVARHVALGNPVTAFSSLFATGSSLVAEARSQLGNGAVYGRASLWCARFVNVILQRTGHTGTGSDAAASFAHYGTRVSGPRVGAIAVMSRRGGGHVGVVSGVDASGGPIIISGNNRNRVREAPVSPGRVYAYVMPN